MHVLCDNKTLLLRRLAAVQLPYIYERSDTNNQSHFVYIHIQRTNTH